MATKLTYSRGDIGPAGGFIFYDNSCGMGRYILEAAPSDACIIHGKVLLIGQTDSIENDEKIKNLNRQEFHSFIEKESDIQKTFEWGNEDILEKTNGYFGAGKKNADLLKDNKKHSASWVCRNLEYNGYNDWFLPSQSELDEMIKILYLDFDGGNIRPCNYWSSTEYLPGSPFSFDYAVSRKSDGSWNNPFEALHKEEMARVRPIRLLKHSLRILN